MKKNQFIVLVSLVISIIVVGCAREESDAEKARKSPDGVISYAYFAVKERNQFKFCEMLDSVDEELFAQFCSAGSDDFAALCDLFSESDDYRVEGISRNNRIVRGSTRFAKLALVGKDGKPAGSINIRVKSSSAVADVIADKKISWRITKISVSLSDKALDGIGSRAGRILKDMQEDVLGF